MPKPRENRGCDVANNQVSSASPPPGSPLQQELSVTPRVCVRAGSRGATVTRNAGSCSRGSDVEHSISAGFDNEDTAWLAEPGWGEVDWNPTGACVPW